MMRVRGFTLIEIMITIVVLVIILAVAVPNLSDLLRRHRLWTQADSFASALSLARSAAISRNTCGAVIATDGDANWRQGWMAFVDANCNRAFDAGEIRLTQSGALPDAMTATFLSSDPGAPYVLYSPVGYTRTAAAGPMQAVMTFADGDHLRRVRINALGRARTCEQASDASCTGVNDE
ncbi:GspH/FimT family pseudopilin [Imbroritus primus]|uniref:GspH/FimT family pseudopilin n=1 Tax=Imbroritus primus TaxID=3058603 RepID=UPI003D16065E